MRILITKKGEELTKELNEDYLETMEIKKYEMARKAHKRMRSSLSKISSRSKSQKSSNRSFNKTNKSKIIKSPKEYEEDKPEVVEKDLQESKKIFIKQKKIYIPKNVTEKYNAEDRQGFILPDLTINTSLNNDKNNSKNKTKYDSYYTRRHPMNMNPMSKTNYDTNMNQNPDNTIRRDRYLLREIVQDETYSNLKKKLIKEKIMEDKLARIDESKFRSVYGEMNKVEKLDKMLENPINSNKISLMKYINQKKTLSNTFIKKIVECNDEKISKANKICQIVYHNKDQWDIVNDRIKEKIEDKKNKEGAKYKSDLKQMGETLRDFSSIISDYEFTDNKRERFRELHNEMDAKYWKRFNIDKLLTRNDRCRNKDNLRRFESVKTRMSKTSNGNFNF